MVEHNEIFLDSVKDLVRSSKYKEACHCAVLLKLHKYFTIEDFLIPLVFQDKYGVAEPFLEGSKKHQIELAKFLDDLLGKRNIKNEVESITIRLSICDVKIVRLYYKPLSKLVSRIIKTFNLPSSTCPNLTLKKGKGALQFLLNKRFITKTLGGEGWAEMALEAVGDDENLQAELVEGITLYGDLKEALTWAEKFGIPEESWPYKLREFNGEQKSNSPAYKEENWDEPNEPTPLLKFHQLSIPESHIKLIDTTSSFSDFLNDINSGVYIIGFDAEWKPTFGLKKCDLSLIQIATDQNAYILDMIALGSSAPQSLWERFANVIFENPNILKLGFGLNEDLTLLKETFRKFHGMKNFDLGFLDLAVLWKTLVQDYNFVFPYSSLDESNSSKGLSNLIELCLGEKLDKSDQFSNWDNRPLRRSQILYAALDAFCLLEAYSAIIKECEFQAIPISEIINEIMDDVASQNQEKKRKKTSRKWKKGDRKYTSTNDCITRTPR